MAKPKVKVTVTRTTDKSDEVKYKSQRKWYLNKHWNGEELTLSQRVTSKAIQSQVAETIRINMVNGEKLSKLTKSLSSMTTSEDISKTMRTIESMARTVTNGDPTLTKEFQKIAGNAKSAILAKIESGDATNLQKAYLKIIDAADNLNMKGLDRAIEKAVKEKALYNARQIAVTEINRAYNMGIYSQAIADSDTLAMQYDLTYAESACEECVEYAETDNGAGPGIYPIDEFPALPIHPQCRCLATPVYTLPDGVTTDDIETSGDFDVMGTVPDNLLDEEE